MPYTFWKQGDLRDYLELVDIVIRIELQRWGSLPMTGAKKLTAGIAPDAVTTDDVPMRVAKNPSYELRIHESRSVPNAAHL